MQRPGRSRFSCFGRDPVIARPRVTARGFLFVPTTVGGVQGHTTPKTGTFSTFFWFLVESKLSSYPKLPGNLPVFSIIRNTSLLTNPECSKTRNAETSTFPRSCFVVI